MMPGRTRSMRRGASFSSRARRQSAELTTSLNNTHSTLTGTTIPEMSASLVVGTSFADLGGRRWRCSRKSLGAGGCGTVYLGSDAQGRLVAIKEVTSTASSERLQEISANEVALLWELQHPNVIAYLGCAVVRSSIVLVMEYLACGSLEGLLASFGSVAESSAQRYVRDILRGLQYLHQHAVVHLDVKPANVLLDHNGVCKLADFGTATTFSALKDRVVSTPAYMAPEVLKGNPVATADVWSLGITLVELITGELPYTVSSAEALLFGLHSGTLQPTVPSTLSKGATAVVRLCLASDPDARPTTNALLQHPFVL
eukprot:TRINITY_DN8734_c0_g1_i1.p1 TRINITY_DN8734_c0_g1~~TRINITY_DN8734_c0_g1_i1.p1  ORF type:complete len:314 (-),score=61.68 TRINITY_DN8734_c0_g1_i1:4-945(-)